MVLAEFRNTRPQCLSGQAAWRQGRGKVRGLGARAQVPSSICRRVQVSEGPAAWQHHQYQTAPQPPLTELMHLSLPGAGAHL